MGQEALQTEVDEDNAEGVQQEVLLPSPCSCTLPSQLLLVTSGNQTGDKVQRLSPSVWLILSAEMQKHYLIYINALQKNPSLIE